MCIFPVKDEKPRIVVSTIRGLIHSIKLQGLITPIWSIILRLLSIPTVTIAAVTLGLDTDEPKDFQQIFAQYTADEKIALLGSAFFFQQIVLS